MMAAGPEQLDDQDWQAAQATLLLEMSREQVFAPHWKLVAQFAFDRVRRQILTGRPLVPPSSYTWLHHEHGCSPAYSERMDAVAAPTERVLLLLLATQAMRHLEPRLDRARVFSALPPRPGEQLLLADSHWWAHCFERAVRQAAADERWTHMVEFDVARADGGIGRRLLLSQLAAAGLPDSWTKVGLRLDEALRPAIGPNGFLHDMMASGAFVTLALAPLDHPIGTPPCPSFRLVDSAMLPARNLAEAEALAAIAVDRLGDLGLRTNRRKTRIVPRHRLHQEWQEADRIRAEIAGAGSARRLLADAAGSGNERFKAEQWALLDLARRGDGSAVEGSAAAFFREPWAARIRALYLREFMTDRPVRERFERELVARAGALHPWQWMWALAALWAGGPPAPATARLVAEIAGSDRWPDPVRAAAAVVWSRFATERGRRMLDQVAAGARSSHLRAAIAFGFRYRSAEARRTILADWSRRDPRVDLVAAAIADEMEPGRAAAGRQE